MKKVLLFSDYKRVFEITNKILDGKHKLIWCTYDLLKKNQYPHSDVVIMHFDSKMIEKGIFESIVKVKGKLGHIVPILAVIEEGTAQDIFSVLEAGAYDYVQIIENLQEYQKKIEEMILWNWYIKKYSIEKK